MKSPHHVAVLVGSLRVNGYSQRLANALMRATPGFGANHVARQTLAPLNMPTLLLPEASISNVRTLFDDDGTLSDSAIEAFLKGFMAAFSRWIVQNTLADGPRIAS